MQASAYDGVLASVEDRREMALAAGSVWLVRLAFLFLVSACGGDTEDVPGTTPPEEPTAEFRAEEMLLECRGFFLRNL